MKHRHLKVISERSDNYGAQTIHRYMQKTGLKYYPVLKTEVIELIGEERLDDIENLHIEHLRGQFLHRISRKHKSIMCQLPETLRRSTKITS
ncbi:MAG: hypothetical protein WC533_00990 [Candidatus Pacearchaeota archaeon]